MRQLLPLLAADEAGQDLAEYGIALAVVAGVVAVAALAIAGNVTILWNNALAVIAMAV